MVVVLFLGKLLNVPVLFDVNPFAAVTAKDKGENAGVMGLGSAVLTLTLCA